jgi:hypothetical protein
MVLKGKYLISFGFDADPRQSTGHALQTVFAREPTEARCEAGLPE